MPSAASGAEPFFRVTKKIHNGLQGAKVDLAAEERKVYLEESERNARLFEERYDFVFVHDPQPAGLLRFREKGDSRWIWRCHIDTSDPDRSVWEFLKGFLNGYDAAIFTLREFIPPDFPLDRVAVVPPAIDPLSPKSIPLPDMIARQVLGWIGVETDRPLLTQVSRFYPWKDPMGVVAAYRLVRKEVPDLQLALVGSMALDDPEGWEIYKAIREESVADPLVHLFTNLTGVGNIEVNAFQRLSDVIVQKSIREGFGLVVSEAMWKGTPVVAGRAGGIPLQMADGVGGVLVESIEECAEAIIRLLKHPEEAGALGKRGQSRVREHFLLPRLLLNHLSLLQALAEGRQTAPPHMEVSRDPVCGMAIERPNIALDWDHRTYFFCSEGCRNRFRIAPDRYLSSRM